MEAETKNKIRELREAKGQKQAELALFLNCSPETLCRYENGKRDPSLAMALRLAAYFDVSTDYLFMLNEKK